MHIYTLVAYNHISTGCRRVWTVAMLPYDGPVANFCAVDSRGGASLVYNYNQVCIAARKASAKEDAG